jgi:hypothetical protein
MDQSARGRTSGYVNLTGPPHADLEKLGVALRNTQTQNEILLCDCRNDLTGSDNSAHCIVAHSALDSR